MISEYDTVRLKKNGKLYTVLEICTDSKTGIPYYYLESEDFDDDFPLLDAEIGEVEFVSRTGNKIVDQLLKDYENRPIF